MVARAIARPAAPHRAGAPACRTLSRGPNGSAGLFFPLKAWRIPPYAALTFVPLAKGNNNMRFDKLTTKFQQALNDAQSLAVGSVRCV